MSIDDDDNIDDTAADTEDFSAPAADPVLIAIEWCRIAKNKTLEAAIRKLAKLKRQYADTQAKLAAVQAQAAELEAALAARAAALDEAQRVLDARTVEFEASLAEAHATLRAYYDQLADTDQRIRCRILSSANLLHGFNERLQDLPTWQQIKQLVPNLPDDLPATPPAKVITAEVSEDWSGNVFVPGSSLTRTVRGASGEQRS